MKVLKKILKKGIVKVIPERVDDLWHLYNIITKGDEVHARTTREKKIEEHYTRPKKGRRVSVLLGVRVQKVLWDRTLNRLRIHGIVCRAPEKLDVTGSHHSIKVILDKPMTIVKKRWSNHQLDRLKRASQPKVAPLIIASIDDEEYCIAVLRQYGIDVRAEEKTRLPGKLEVEKRAKAFGEFFKKALGALRVMWTRLHSPMVIIGPGFVKNDFVKYINNQDPDVASAIIDVKGVNSGGLAGIQEALRSGIFTKALRYVRIAEEARLMEVVLTRLGKGVLDVTYGLGEVEKAGSFGAIERLLLADVTLRESSDEERMALEDLMRKVEERGGEVTIISVEHEAGTKLLSLGGVAALLRFPLA
ncbi:MAG: mRNA surveillance protein pelota [Candidatus Bathyarchaeota archaeon]|nr:MAG: mRNA surveillance protein pelota [Candidatus Bathyarchaeota archaeon]